MKKRILLKALMLSCSLLWLSCSDDNNGESPIELSPLAFEHDSYEVREDFMKNIPVFTGNQAYTTKVEDTEIVKAQTWFNEGAKNAGYLRLDGLKKGETVVCVTDIASKESVNLKVKVTDFYMGFVIETTNDGIFPKGDFLYLLKDKEKSFYILGNKDGQVTEETKVKGTYTTGIENGIPYLFLTYLNKENQEVTRKFNFSESSSAIIQLFNDYFGLSTKEIQNRMNVLPKQYMILKEAQTGVELKFGIENSDLPESILP